MSRWTIEARKKQSQLIRCWRPWERSTGAKTPEGKATSKMNALKHGGRSAEVREAHKQMAKQKRLLKDIINFI